VVVGSVSPNPKISKEIEIVKIIWGRRYRCIDIEDIDFEIGIHDFTGRRERIIEI